MHDHDPATLMHSRGTDITKDPGLHGILGRSIVRKFSSALVFSDHGHLTPKMSVHAAEPWFHIQVKAP